jgi:hypothetical protein
MLSELASMSPEERIMLLKTEFRILIIHEDKADKAAARANSAGRDLTDSLGGRIHTVRDLLDGYNALRRRDKALDDHKMELTLAGESRARLAKRLS